MRGRGNRILGFGVAVIGLVALLTGCRVSEAEKQENREMCWEATEALSDPTNPPLAQEDIAAILRQCEAAGSEKVMRAVEYGDNMAVVETDSGKMHGHKIIAERTASGWEIRATYVWMF